MLGTPVFDSQGLSRENAGLFSGAKRRSVWNMNAVDAQGRKRFHGAFTGGFSAGYFNSVGSEEGFTPANFSSSRKNRAGSNFSQSRPEDFMDEEDLESGITLVFTEKIDGNELMRRMSKKIKNEELKSHEKPVIGPLLPDKMIVNRFFVSPVQMPKIKDDSYGLGYEPSDEIIKIRNQKRLKDADMRRKDELKRLGKVSMSSNSKIKTSIGLGISALEDVDDIEVYDADDAFEYDFERDSDDHEDKFENASDNENFFSCTTKTFIRNGSLSNSFGSCSLKCDPLIIPEDFDGKHVHNEISLDPALIQHQEEILRRNFILSKYRSSGHQITPQERSHLFGMQPEEFARLDQTDDRQDGALSAVDRAEIAANLCNKFRVGSKQAFSTNQREESVLSEITRFRPYEKDISKQRRFEIFCKIKLDKRSSNYNRNLLIHSDEIRSKLEYSSLGRFQIEAELAEFEKVYSKWIHRKDNSAINKTASSLRKSSTFREVLPWTPSKLLCKRFQVIQPNQPVAFSNKSNSEMLMYKSTNVAKDNFHSLSRYLPSTSTLNTQGTVSSTPPEEVCDSSKDKSNNVLSDEKDSLREKLASAAPSMDLFSMIFNEESEEED